MGHCGGCASANERCGNGLEKIYPTTAIRFGRMRHIGEFSHAPEMKFSCGAKVVISTDRGIEIGDQVSLTCFGCEKSVPRDQMRTYAETCGGEAYQLKRGRILREATEADLAEWKHIEDDIFNKLQTARRVSNELELAMKVVDCEHLFGGERIVLYFLAEERIDFRELVRILAGEFQTRIEMRQIGARDEARLVADYETCGRECCCKTFLKTLKPISMGMAKLQKATLDPSKVSGRCGRLKCCLRYEHESYEEMDAKLPKVGVRVRTSHGTGQIIDRQILTQLVKIRCDDDKIVAVVAEDILERNLPMPQFEPRQESDDDRRRGGDRNRGGDRGNRPDRGGSPPQDPPRAAAPAALPLENPIVEAEIDSPNEPNDSSDDSGNGNDPNEPRSNGIQEDRSRGPRRRRRRFRGDGGQGPRPENPGPNA